MLAEARQKNVIDDINDIRYLESWFELHKDHGKIEKETLGTSKFISVYTSECFYV